MRIINSRRGILTDATRVVRAAQIFDYVGMELAKRSKLIGAMVAPFAINSCHVQHSQGESGAQALALVPIAIGAAYTLGTALRYVPRMFLRWHENYAIANDLNLMEDYRKQNSPQHLEYLWNRVFKHEPLDEYLLSNIDSPGLEAIVKKRDWRTAFLRQAKTAIDQHLPQLTQRQHYGLPLQMIEDWNDSGPFDLGDCKLLEEYAGRTALVEAKRIAGYSWKNRARDSVEYRVAWMWQRALYLAVAAEVGAELRRLSYDYRTNILNSQVLLWPGQEDEPAISQLRDATGHATAREAILAARHRIIHHCLGSDFATAKRRLSHMLNGPYDLALTLRLRFDAEYVLKELNCQPKKDLKANGYSQSFIARADGLSRSARENFRPFDAWLANHRPKLSYEACRAVRIAFFTDYEGLQNRFKSGHDVSTAIDSIASEKRAWTDRLVSVRLLHELAYLQKQEYHTLVHRLAYPEAEQSTDNSPLQSYKPPQPRLKHLYRKKALA